MLFICNDTDTNTDSIHIMIFQKLKISPTDMDSIPIGIICIIVQNIFWDFHRHQTIGIVNCNIYKCVIVSG